MPKLKILPMNIEVDVEENTVLADAIKAVIPEFPTPCGGLGFCGRCRVRVIVDGLSEPSGNERVLLGGSRFRLSCQAKVIGDTVVEILKPHEEHKITVSGIEPTIEFRDPIIRAIEVRLNGVFEAPLSKVLLEEAGGTIHVDGAVLKLANVKSKNVRVLVDWSGRIIGLRENRSRNLGLAVDLGTTKIAGYLVDLETGESLGESYVINPQIDFGDDVVTRIMRALEPKGLIELRERAIAGIESVALKTCSREGLNPKDIVASVIVGNNVMTNILLGLPVETLAKHPYQPILASPVLLRGKTVGFNLLENTLIYMPPGVAGFVGSDAVADIVLVWKLGLNGKILILDVGTNTEIVLIEDWRRILVTSAPAGPAVEGAHISIGARVVDRAFRKARVSSRGEIILEPSIENPVGLTGSALISLLACLLEKNYIDEGGRIVEGFDVDSTGLKRITVYRSRDGETLSLTQLDVRELQKAKAAIAAGWRTILEKAGTNALDYVVVAGSFGSSINVEHAIRIGLLPDVGRDKVIVVGNAAGIGAKAIMLNGECRRVGEEVSRKAFYLNLAELGEWEKTWVQSLFLRPIKIS